MNLRRINWSKVDGSAAGFFKLAEYRTRSDQSGVFKSTTVRRSRRAADSEIGHLRIGLAAAASAHLLGSAGRSAIARMSAATLRRPDTASPL
jgi:hypothetical protein